MNGQTFDLAVSYFIRGQYARAVDFLEEGLRSDPQDARGWTYLGMSYAHLGNSHQAERSLAKAIELAPEDGEAWFHLGVARSMRSEWPQAVSAYRHAVALAPDDLVAWHRLGVAFSESGDEGEAKAAFERALVLSRETGEPPLEEPVNDASDPHLEEPGEEESEHEVTSWLDLALSLLSLGEEEEAIAAYERAYTLDPERARRSLFRPMLHLVTAATPQISGAYGIGGPRDDRGPVPPVRPKAPADPDWGPGELR